MNLERPWKMVGLRTGRGGGGSSLHFRTRVTPHKWLLPFSLGQRGNPVLKFVRNVPWEFGEVIPDYVLGQSTCALFLR